MLSLSDLVRPRGNHTGFLVPVDLRLSRKFFPQEFNWPPFVAQSRIQSENVDKQNTVDVSPRGIFADLIEW